MAALPLLAQTVVPAVFLPVEGTSLAVSPVVVTCPTEGAVIRHTVTGAEPTIHDLPLISGGTVSSLGI